MKKTNVMIEVSDDVYNKVVQPYKSRKSFGHLVTILLDAFANNDAIYSYITGAMDGIEDMAKEELLKDLNSMTESLSMFSALSSQMESVIDNGQKKFDEFSSKAQEDLGKEEFKTHQESTTLTREDVVSIVNDSVGEIKDMLMRVLSGNMVSTSQEVVKEVVVSNDKVAIKEEVNNVVSEVVPISKEEEELAQNALSSLVGSLSW